MPTRLIHVSDLHVGAPEERPIEPALRALVAEIEPALIVATGDLTHRGSPLQHEQAAAFLQSLGPPVLAIPGNHDIPHTFPARFTRPWREFERHLSPATVRGGLGFWAYFAKRPRLYGLATGLLSRALALIARRKGRFGWLPFARGWTSHREFPAPEGATFQAQWKARRVNRR